MFRRQEFKKLFSSKELKLDSNLNEKELEKLGLKKYEYAQEDVVYYVFYGTAAMLNKLPFASWTILTSLTCHRYCGGIFL